MKCYFLFLLCSLLFFSTAFAQNKKTTKIEKDIFGNTIFETNGKKLKISRDIFGYLQLEENGRKKASLKKDVFDNHIYEDTNNNKITYSKEFWTDLLKDFRNNEEKVFLWLIDEYRDTKNYKKEYKVDIFGDKIIEDNKGNKTTIGKDIQGNHVVESTGKKIKLSRDIFGYLQLEENNRKKAYLKKDIFDTWIFNDYSNNNELKYSKEFWADILKDFRGDEEKAFFWLMDMCQGLKNYKEEYKIDIFGYLQFENNQKEKATLKKNIFNEMEYEDNNGNKLTYPQDIWNKMKRRSTDKRIFMDFIQRYLFQ